MSPAEIELLKAATREGLAALILLADDVIDIDAKEGEPSRIVADFMFKHRQAIGISMGIAQVSAGDQRFENLLKAARRAIVVMAHAANENPMYVDGYCELSNAIDAAVGGGSK